MKWDGATWAVLLTIAGSIVAAGIAWGAHGERLDSINQTIGKHDARLERIENGFHKLDKVTTRLESAVDHLEEHNRHE